MKHSGRQRSLLDIAKRQRNLVFPDTAANEARMWRNLIASKQKLRPIQVIGIVLIYLALAGVVYEIISTQMRDSGIQGTLWDRVIGNFGAWILLLGLAAVVLLIGHVISRRSRRSEESAKNPK